MDPGELPAELDARFLRALEQLDAGEHYEAHEELEELWAGEVGATRRMLQALIQVAVALHHRSHGNFGGAITLCERACAHLEAVPRETCFIEPGELRGRVKALREEAAAARALDDPGAGGPPPLDPAKVPRFDAVRARIRAARRERGLEG
jgi:hypothetical protein